MGKAAEKKRKKKGRPSLLDLQKRSLRLQKQHEQEQQQQKRNPNASTNPYARFPNPPIARRPARRNPNSEPDTSSAARVDDVSAAASVEDDEEEDEPSGRRKEKKLKLVLHLPHADANFSDAPPCPASDSEGAAPKKWKINAAGKEEDKSSWKATEDTQGKTVDLGPTTPLPDKNLLEFILDRLQKKDTYGVFSEPVDPDELPDYHDIIKHPMDFGTVRNRLSSGAYKDLEQFEKDVFLISSNAMRYNASDTIYFRQARSIHELAKKNFENIRQESDGTEPEPKIVRRGRPPGTGKNNIKQPVGKPPAENACSEYSSEAHLLPNAVNRNHTSNALHDSLKKGMVLHKPGVADASARAALCVQSSEAYVLSHENKSVGTEDYSVIAGSAWKGPSNTANNTLSTDDNRRDTYKLYSSFSAPELPVLTVLGGERKFLVPVGLHVEHAYARSLARFAADIGPGGWKLAAMRIKKALPPGTEFGPGWVGESDAPPSLHSSSVLSDGPCKGDKRPERQEEPPSNESAKQDYPFRIHPAPSSCQISMLQPPSNGFKAPFASNQHQPGRFHLEKCLSKQF